MRSHMLTCKFACPHFPLALVVPKPADEVASQAQSLYEKAEVCQDLQQLIKRLSIPPQLSEDAGEQHTHGYMHGFGLSI